MPESPVITVISVVDDDDSVRESLHGLLRSVGYRVQVFPSAEAFLRFGDVLHSDCLILDVRMQGLSGLALQRQLRGMGVQVPVVFVTALDDARTRAEAFAGGAAAILVKPFSEESLLAALDGALRTG